MFLLNRSTNEITSNCIYKNLPDYGHIAFHGQRQLGQLCEVASKEIFSWNPVMAKVTTNVIVPASSNVELLKSSVYTLQIHDEFRESTKNPDN